MMRDQKKMKKYIKAIERKLNMPKAVKARVMMDLVSSVQGRREAGKTDEEIFEELGSPKKAAADLNEQMKDYTYIKSPWRWVCLAIMIVCGLALIFGGTAGFLAFLLSASVADSVGVIGGVDGPTAIFVSAPFDYIWYQTGIILLILMMAILGFYRLSRCPRK